MVRKKQLLEHPETYVLTVSISLLYRGKPKGEASWESNFLLLKQFMRENGHAHVPTRSPQWKTLGRWVSTQRAMYRDYHLGRQFPPPIQDLIRPRLIKLASVGFAWQMGPRQGLCTHEKDSAKVLASIKKAKPPP